MKHILILISFLLLNLPSAHGACEKAESMFSSATSVTRGPQERIRLLRASLDVCESYAAYYELGRSHYEMQDWDAARFALDRAVRLARTAEEKAWALRALARVHRQRGQVREAVVCYRTALRFQADRAMEREMMALERDRFYAMQGARQIAASLNSPVYRALGLAPVVDVRVHFEFDSFRLTVEGKRQIKEMGKAIAALYGKRVTLTGHTDARGTEAYNLGLSQNRARAVRSYLLESVAMDPSLIQWKGEGEHRLLFHDGTELAHALNRRVEIRLD
ncbi:MAG: OmpA family protein [Deltaproteobacteria bacterium]|nr:OmpA family protein [Deltaproteobacteria bacterium]